MRTTRTKLTARASLLILRARPAPRQVCLAAGSDIPDHADGASKILNISRSYFAPEAVDAIHQQVMRISPLMDKSLSLISSIGRPSPKWLWGLVPRSNLYRYCVWTTQPYPAKKSPWLWQAATRACGLRTRRQICLDYLVCAGAAADKMLCLRKRQRSPP